MTNTFLGTMWFFWLLMNKDVIESQVGKIFIWSKVTTWSLKRGISSLNRQTIHKVYWHGKVEICSLQDEQFIFISIMITFCISALAEDFLQSLLFKKWQVFKVVFWGNGISQLSVNTPKLNTTIIMAFVEGWLEIK